VGVPTATGVECGGGSGCVRRRDGLGGNGRISYRQHSRRTVHEGSHGVRHGHGIGSAVGSAHAGDGQNVRVASGDIAAVTQITKSCLVPLVLKGRGARSGDLEGGGGAVDVGDALRLGSYGGVGEPHESVAAGDA